MPWTEYKPTGEPEIVESCHHRRETVARLFRRTRIMNRKQKNPTRKHKHINTNNKTTLFISVCFTYLTQPVFHKLFSLVNIVILSLKGNGKDL